MSKLLTPSDLLTLEAYAKARGLGLHLPLDRFGFAFGDDGAPRLEHDDTAGADVTAWRFWRTDLGPHRLAVAAEQPRNDAALVVRVLQHAW